MRMWGCGKGDYHSDRSAAGAVWGSVMGQGKMSLPVQAYGLRSSCDNDGFCLPTMVTRFSVLSFVKILGYSRSFVRTLYFDV